MECKHINPYTCIFFSCTIHSNYITWNMAFSQQEWRWLLGRCTLQSGGYWSKFQRKYCPHHQDDGSVSTRIHSATSRNYVGLEILAYRQTRNAVITFVLTHSCHCCMESIECGSILPKSGTPSHNTTQQHFINTHHVQSYVISLDFDILKA